MREYQLFRKQVYVFLFYKDKPVQSVSCESMKGYTPPLTHFRAQRDATSQFFRWQFDPPGFLTNLAH